MDNQPRTQLLEEFVDWLLPLLKPYEVTIYLYLLRKSHLDSGGSQIRIGKRTISKDCGQGTRSISGGSFKHITEVLQALESKGCISIGDTSREGTLYTVMLPTEIPTVRKRLSALKSHPQALNHYSDPHLRRELFERDKWTCQYCGERVTAKNATLDHKIPVSKKGTDSPDNLTTCCFICNSIKSGKTYDEAAPAILASIRDRRLRP